MDEENSTLDFDQFWDDYTQTADGASSQQVKVFGEYYTLTVDVPFALLVKAMTTDHHNVQGMSDLIDQLYGEGTMGDWLSKGLSMKQLPILCAWSIARIQGRDLSFEEVASQLKEFMGGKGPTSSDDTGPPLNRASRRAMEKKLSKSGK